MSLRRDNNLRQGLMGGPGLADGFSDRLARFDDDQEQGQGIHLSFTDLMAILLVFFVLFFSLVKPMKEGEYGLPLRHQLSGRIDPHRLEEGRMEAKRQGIMSRLISAAPAWAEGMINQEVKVRQRALDRLSDSLLTAETMAGRSPIRPVLSPEQLLSTTSGPPKLPLVKVKAPVTRSIGGDRQRLVAGMKRFTDSLTDLQVELRTSGRAVVLEIGDKVTFEQGRADIKPRFRAMLTKLTATLIRENHNLAGIRIKGHTDSVPIKTELYPSNWELSGSRAARVARLMIEAGLRPQLFEISGYSKYRPAAENDSDPHRAQNRRVEIELRVG